MLLHNKENLRRRRTRVKPMMQKCKNITLILESVVDVISGRQYPKIYCLKTCLKSFLNATFKVSGTLNVPPKNISIFVDINFFL